MDRLADLVKGSNTQNPFSDSQARNFSDSKITREFCPVSSFWSLFNDQHEILLGTRGSGKTFLLKMMRYSMLKTINHPIAKQLVSEKKFLALYVPMYLEFVTHLAAGDSSEEEQVQLFQFAFNCLLAQSLITELDAILSEETDKYKRALKNLNLTSDLNKMWFINEGDEVSDLFSLTTKLKKMFYNFDVSTGDLATVPSVFKRQIGASLLVVKELVAHQLGLAEEPTWIICIDEAEFLTLPLQRCINSVFRSDSRRIALKVATLPYYHKTLETLERSITVSVGNDFNYRVVDMKFDGSDFISVTNALCAHRMKTRFNSRLEIEKLEDFVGVCGKDDQVDYYRKELGVEETSYDKITAQIISELSKKRRKSASKYPNPRKTIYDKFAPVFFVRRMYRLSNKGNSVPGWYAGGAMIRKISQGNPRAFIQIMNKLFEKARKSELTPKAQHEVIIDYVTSICESTQALEMYGPSIHRELAEISTQLHKHVHDSDLISAGCNFTLSCESGTSFDSIKNWIQLAIAYSRIIVNEDALKNGIKEDTEYLLANTYAAKYWLPMRGDVSPKCIKIINNQVLTYTVKTSPADQLSLFEEETV